MLIGWTVPIGRLTPSVRFRRRFPRRLPRIGSLLWRVTHLSWSVLWGARNGVVRVAVFGVKTRRGRVSCDSFFKCFRGTGARRAVLFNATNALAVKITFVDSIELSPDASIVLHNSTILFTIPSRLYEPLGLTLRGTCLTSPIRIHAYILRKISVYCSLSDRSIE